MHLLADRKLLDQRGVPGLVSWALDDVASRIAECSLNGVVCKRTCIEQGPANTRTGVGVADQIRAGAIEADGTSAIGIRDGGDIGSGVVVARGGGKDPSELPVAKNLVHEAGSVFGKHPSAAEGQVADIAEE